LKKIRQWSTRDEEYVKRMAFSLIAELAWWEKRLTDADFEQFFPMIKAAATELTSEKVQARLRKLARRRTL